MTWLNYPWLISITTEQKIDSLNNFIFYSKSCREEAYLVVKIEHERAKVSYKLFKVPDRILLNFPDGVSSFPDGVSADTPDTPLAPPLLIGHFVLLTIMSTSSMMIL